jgi:hypothetical protein
MRPLCSLQGAFGFGGSSGAGRYGRDARGAQRRATAARYHASLVQALPAMKGGPLLDAVLESVGGAARAAARPPKHAPHDLARAGRGDARRLVTFAATNWGVTATAALLRRGRGLGAHSSNVVAAVRRDREGLFDLFVPGGAPPPQPAVRRRKAPQRTPLMLSTRPPQVRTRSSAPRLASSSPR